MILQSGTWARLEGLTSAPAVAMEYATEAIFRVHPELYPARKEWGGETNTCPKCGDIKSRNGEQCKACANRFKDEKRMEHNLRAQHFRAMEGFTRWDGPY